MKIAPLLGSANTGVANQPMDDGAAIAAWLAVRSATKCPTKTAKGADGKSELQHMREALLALNPAWCAGGRRRNTVRGAAQSSARDRAIQESIERGIDRRIAGDG